MVERGGGRHRKRERGGGRGKRGVFIPGIFNPALLVTVKTNRETLRDGKPAKMIQRGK